MDLNGKTIFITGGTGSFGKACIETLLSAHDPRVIRIFSRDELKQSEMQTHYAGESRLRFFLGDVRDRDRLVHATRGVDLIIHAAVLLVCVGAIGFLLLTRKRFLIRQHANSDRLRHLL